MLKHLAVGLCADNAEATQSDNVQRPQRIDFRVLIGFDVLLKSVKLSASSAEILGPRGLWWSA